MTRQEVLIKASEKVFSASSDVVVCCGGDTALSI